jgi:hypothetical protein
MESIKDTIAKLLALSGSPNENEARLALLKARELMVKHKLRDADVIRMDKQEVIERTIGITCTKTKHAWATNLAAIIAEHYCCRSFRSHKKGDKKVELGLIGLEDDFEVCERIVKYAYDCVVSRCKEIRGEYKGRVEAYLIREAENAYGFGFCEGLGVAYKEQDKTHQEYGLVLVMPKEVAEVTKRIGNASHFSRPNYEGWRESCGTRGYQDGKKFNPTTKLTSGGAIS